MILLLHLVWLASRMPHRKIGDDFVKYPSEKINFEETAGDGGKNGASHVMHSFRPERAPMPVGVPTRRNESINVKVTFLSLSGT
jgi:hypothetical protein